ncbi:MAG TPA: hypothetical protein VLA21_05705 [Candidatus Limnocylindria bacterium]|nr:hypothetical protein [Candidatus Limnocylindria bacterium]
MIELYSRVLLKDGSVGDVIGVFDAPAQEYLVDVSGTHPDAPAPDGWLRTVKPENIEKVLQEPQR